MEREFIPKKTITVQLTIDTMEKFKELCEAWDLPKTKTVEKMILEAYNGLFSED